LNDPVEPTVATNDDFKCSLEESYREQSSRFNTAVLQASGLGSTVIAGLLAFGDLFENAPAGANWLVASAIVLVLAGLSSGACDFHIQRLFHNALDAYEVKQDKAGADKKCEQANKHGGAWNWITAALAAIGILLFCIALVMVAATYESRDRNHPHLKFKGQDGKYELDVE
jgi:hypothetical protein